VNKIFHFKKIILIFIALGIVITATWSYGGFMQGNSSFKESASNEFCNYTLSNSQFSSRCFTSYGYSASVCIYSPFSSDKAGENYTYVFQDFTILKDSGNNSWSSFCSVHLNLTNETISEAILHITPGKYKMEFAIVLDYTNFSKLVNATPTPENQGCVVLNTGFPTLLFSLAIIDLVALSTFIILGYIWFRSDLKQEILIK
jgi:hypothetical protein